MNEQTNTTIPPGEIPHAERWSQQNSPGGKTPRQMTAFIFFCAGFIAALFIIDPFKHHIK